MKMKMKMKKKLTLLLAFALVLSMIPAPASAALKSAGSPTEVQALVSSENVEHNFVKVTANGSTLDIEVETPVVASEYNFNVIKAGNTGGAEYCLPGAECGHGADFRLPDGKQRCHRQEARRGKDP